MKKKQIELHITLPEEVDLELSSLPEEYMRDVLIGVLYAQGKITSHEACLILGTTKRDFIQMLQHNHIPVGGYTIDGDIEENRSLYLRA